MPISVSNALSVSFAGLYDMGGMEAPQVDSWKDIADPAPMNTTSVLLARPGAVGEMVPFDGDRVTQKVKMSEGRMMSHPFELTLEADVFQLSNLEYVTGIGESAYDMGQTVALHPVRHCFRALKSAASTTYTVKLAKKQHTYPMVGYDKQPLLSASHPQFGGGVASNYITGGGGQRWYIVAQTGPKPLRWGTFLTPIFDEDLEARRERSAYRWRALRHDGIGVREWRTIYSTDAPFNNASLNEAIVNMGKFRNDSGALIGPRPIKVIAPWSMRSEVKKVLGTKRGDGDVYNFNADDSEVSYRLSVWLDD